MAAKKEMVRDRLIVRTSVIAIVTNLCLVGFKVLVGLMANSIAIVLDAMNNLSDALSSVITILGTKLASRPPDKKHPFGYGRVEYLTAILISCLILFAGVSFAVTSVKKIIHPDETNYSLVTVVIVVVAIVTKLVLGAYTRRMGKETESDALVASGADATFDAVISAGTLVGALVAMATEYVIDGWIGALISLAIMKAGLELLMDTLSSIVGRRADSALTKEMKQRLCTVDGILGAYDLVLHNYGPTRTIGAVNVAVYDWRTAAELHAISKQAQQLILDEYAIQLYVGFYAVNTQEDDLKELEQSVREYVQAQPYVLSMHAFYEDSRTKAISFDVVIDFAASNVRRELAHGLEEALEAQHPGRSFSIRIDRDYSD
ncbi:MAG: cation diffusion facilitator family transporter [Evtepia sp.]|uniref:cation diffusion facilitator family transporter n=1 Tax=Evtepia sp. TaxID=2773933 RepID=UPI002A74D7E3|nr:cation diffusion facilitator family transporter [Evtepia sp.]MDY3014796.1 cation diffusion facilitator family transporter [Evtepia sp.]